MTFEQQQMAMIEKAAKRIWDMAKVDPELAARIPDPDVLQAFHEPGASYQRLIAKVLSAYADRPALGKRDYDIVTDANGRSVRRHLPAFKTITYSDLARQIEAIANLWWHHPVHRLETNEHIGLMAFTGAEMFTVDHACVFAGTVSVPLQANLQKSDMENILQDTAPAALLASIDNLELTAGYALGQDTVRSLIVIDADERVDDERELIEVTRQRLADAGGRVSLITFPEAVEFGRQIPFEMRPDPELGVDHVSLLLFTSGSTGTPKGAIIPDSMPIDYWRVIGTGAPTISLAYAPMNHFMGRSQIYSTLTQGGTVYFTLKSDMSTLFEDIRLAGPTYIAFMPRVCELVFQHHQSEVARRVALGEDPAVADREVQKEMKGFYLGHRVNFGGVGSSPTAPEVRKFISDCFDIPVIDGYGSTEAGGNALTILNRIVSRLVIDFKLVDVPELGYYTTDKPYPRGEFLVKPVVQFKGYYNRPEATAAVFTEDGFIKTGDIMEQRGPDELVWLDRRNNVIKLSQAEFVAVAPLEMTYLANSDFIKQIFLYGNSYRSYLLAVVVPDVGIAKARLGHDPSMEELRKMALEALQTAARKAGLKTFEIPRDVIIELEPFSYENGLLSSARKPLRPNIKRRYVDALEAMYQEIDRLQQQELAQLRSSDAGTLIERVAGAFKASLGLAKIDPESSQSYGDLGGDSLGAVGLSALLEEMFDVTVPVSVILHPAASVGQIANYIELAAAGGAVQFEAVHPDPANLLATDLQLDKFLGPDALAAAGTIAPPVEEVRTVLLTGANGFLGRFLLLAWLEYVSRRDGKVICLLRGKDLDAARARLEKAFDTGDGALLRRFRELADKHLEIVPGDLAAPQLGLAPDMFAGLAQDVDHIVHPAALVNHRLSYQNLFEPNVVGTAELIRLALTERLKRFDFVSTVGVPYTNPGLLDASERIDVREGAPIVPLSENYASGYAASKWAGEVLLREAHENFGLPVNVFRPNMILPHSQYRGQYNDTDMITRLLYSLVKTGLAPHSFYELDADGNRPRAHYDGLPVDFLAATMQELGSRPYSGVATYNMINGHDDGVSLDSFADWVESAGFPIDRLNHQDWVQRFEGKLRNLSEEERQHSSLNILGYVERPQQPDVKLLSRAEFEQAVRSVSVGPKIPHLTEAYIHSYLAGMEARGLFSAPVAAVA